MIPAAPDSEPPVRILFEGKDLVVRGAPEFAGDTLVVTFSSRSERGPGGFRPEGFGERFLRKQQVPHICFVNKANHWWQTPEFATAMDVVKAGDALSRFKRIVTYGASMGAYGALLGADALDADVCLAFSPQFRVDGSLPLNPVWEADLAGWPVLHEPFATRSPKPGSDIFVFFDDLHPIDRKHADALRKVHPCRPVLAPGATHSAALYLQNAGLLKDIVTGALAGELDDRQTRARLRSLRRDDPSYWQGLAMHLARHGRSELAMRWHETSLELAFRQPALHADLLHAQVKLMLNAMLAAKRSAEAADLVERYQAAAPRDVRACILASRLERGRGRPKAAVRHAREAVALAPKSALANLTLAMALGAAGKMDAAGKFADIASGQRKGATHRDWIEAAMLFRSLDMPALATIAIESARRIRPQDPKVKALSESATQAVTV